jgi:phosphoglycolate phosphatase-like HAD superfamily hydrolase
VGGDELIFEFKGSEPKARFFLNRVVSAVDQHFRGKYAFVAIHRPSLVASEIDALKALPGAMVLERYGAGYRLIVERKPGRFPSALAAWARERGLAAVHSPAGRERSEEIRKIVNKELVNLAAPERVLPGTRALLEFLRESGVRLEIATSGSTETRTRVLRGLGLSEFFRTLHGGGNCSWALKILIIG